MRKICVFLGAATGNAPAFKNDAYQLGQIIAARGFGLVYGGGQRGLMGAVADSVIASRGSVTGIIPKFLENIEMGHPDVNDLRVIDTMHERKAMMYDLADAFIVMPGGLGTLDEAMEIITWRQLGLHHKPIIIVNLNGYWAPMLTMFQNIIDQGFMHHGHVGHYETASTLDELADMLDALPGTGNAFASE